MSKQRRDAAVLSDAAKFNAVTRSLKRLLRRNGIRSTNSAKARDAIRRAVTLPVSELGRGRA